MNQIRGATGRKLPIAVISLLSWLSCEAAVLKGVVIANEVGGEPIPRAEVSAITGANPTQTDSFGKFSLTFPQQKPGDTIHVIVHKAGYVVVNDIQLELALPGDAGAKPLIVILCKVPNREEMARRFYRLKSTEAIGASYQKRLKALELEQRANSDEISRLQRERDEATNAAVQAADAFARIKPGQTSELYRRALRLFLDGRIDLAVEMLDDQKLRGLSAAAKARKEAAEKDVQQGAQAWVLKARFLTLQFRFDEAERAFRAAMETTPDDFDVNFAFANFSEYLNRFKNARTAYEHCLDLARRDGSDYGTANALFALGILNHAQNRPDDALQSYRAALKIYRMLADKYHGKYQLDIANCLNNMGYVYRFQNRMDESLLAYTSAQTIYRKLVDKNPELYHACPN